MLLSGGTITTGALATPTTGRIRIDDFAQRSLITFPVGVPDYTALFAATATARAGDTIINGNLATGLFEARSTGLLRVTGTINAAIGARLGVGSLQVGSLATQGFLDLSAVDSLVLADLAAQGQISLASDGSITAGNVTTGQSLVLAANRAGASLTTGNVRADGEIRLSSNTTLTAGTLSSGNRVFLTAGGAITTGAIDAGTVNPQAGASGVLFATSPATIRTGAINVSGSATLSGVLGVTTGNIAAPGGIVLLDTGGINAGNLTTSPSGFVYIAAHDLLPQISFDQAGNPLFAALLTSTPIRLVGDITVGDATTGRFIAAATGNFFVNNATAATSMLVDVGGTATLDFNINTPSLTVTSSDIFLDPLATVGAAGGSILFNTTGANTAIVGGANAAAVPGTYRLSNAEFGGAEGQQHHGAQLCWRHDGRSVGAAGDCTGPSGQSGCDSADQRHDAGDGRCHHGAGRGGQPPEPDRRQPDRSGAGQWQRAPGRRDRYAGGHAGHHRAAPLGGQRQPAHPVGRQYVGRDRPALMP